MDFTRPAPADPYSLLPAPAVFTLTGPDVVDGERLPVAYTVDGEALSPALEWSGAPAGTRSFAVSCFDPDAPSPSGYWHWNLVDLPAEVTSLPRGAGGADGGLLPAGAFQVRGDGGYPGFEGAGPPRGDHEHRYVFAVHALDAAPGRLVPGPGSTNAQVHVSIFFHLLGRATLTATYGR
ncbi:YbhB/YbcL family Raf kinase inhibitor-like protein [Myceligenerans indicum]|uniref:YbhB/YbcL family Raf kinase inhibitor-like protein n=1 Tax=Myceligenerans indicum TaxID=2593663 RepID=A0ABS1LRE6_9MICO|nr:YbhB/YbcL family Raf kinase inhibitor-like protein [Myceligenerans indicum]MBL0888092.1 YbhB/YbcL family Raf kinase inhibitor-like protein [Myceligenerans indicum]